jgi:membrane protein implicated in regulation of membrane protease activity
MEVYLVEQAPWFWLVAALVFAVFEVLLPAFVFLFISAAAVVAMLFALCGASFGAQLVAFGVGIAGFLALLRRPVLAKLRTAPDLPSRTERLIGKSGLVTEPLDPLTGRGRVVVEGEDWAGLCVMPAPAGTLVRVVGADGIVLLAEPQASDT